MLAPARVRPNSRWRMFKQSNCSCESLGFGLQNVFTDLKVMSSRALRKLKGWFSTDLKYINKVTVSSVYSYDVYQVSHDL